MNQALLQVSSSSSQMGKTKSPKYNFQNATRLASNFWGAKTCAPKIAVSPFKSQKTFYIAKHFSHFEFVLPLLQTGSSKNESAALLQLHESGGSAGASSRVLAEAGGIMSGYLLPTKSCSDRMCCTKQNSI